MKTLVIGKIWPEPNSSAAGRRTLDLLRALTRAGWETHFACSAQPSLHSVKIEGLGKGALHQIELNASSFDTWIKTLAPDIVVFDRYMTEEQFAWRVAESLPQALRVIDTSDLHCLREARHHQLKTGEALNLLNPIALREIAAILRSDLSLIISEAEMDLLDRHFPVPDFRIAYWPFCLPDPLPNPPSFEQRSDFVMIGSFLHEPNWDAVRWCRQEIWPRLRERLPETTLHIYGSYPTSKILHLHNPDLGFLVKGRAAEAVPTLSRYRVNLAPLRFGAGLKGKLADSFLAGTPSAATPIAIEGLPGDLPWGSDVAADPDTFVSTAASLYQNADLWETAKACGYAIARERFAESQWLPRLPELLAKAHRDRESNRLRHFVGQLLNHHHHRSSEFMSRWIEEKNRNA